MAMFLDLKVGESLSIDGGRVKITLEDKSGKLARLRVVAEKSIPVVKSVGSGAAKLARNGIL